MSDKILTVIVPSYNMEKYLPKCLGSLVVAPELMEKLEVLVVNDGSKDRTSEIAHEFEAKYPQTFKVIDKPNGNYGSCINAALPVVTGFYVKVVDADDYVETPAFAKSIEILSQEAEKGDSSVDLLVTNYDQVDEDGNVTATCDYKLGEEGCRTLAEVPETTPRFTIHSIAYKTENLRKINYRQTEGISYTDTEWIIEPMVTVKKFYYLPLIGAHYLVGRAGQTMESATFAKKFQQVADVTQNIVSRYMHLMLIAEPKALKYYKQQVRVMIAMVYRGAITSLNHIRAVCNLKYFDEHLRLVPELYDFGGGLKITSCLYTFHYVAEWRRKHSKKTFKFFLFGLHQLTVRARAKFCNWLKKVIG